MKYILPLILLAASAGCESLQYRGVAANVRSFSEDPRLNQYYIGVDFEYAVVDPPDPNQPAQEEVSVAPFFPDDPDIIPRPLPEPRIPW